MQGGLDVGVGMSKVGGDGERSFAVAEDITDGFDGVVREAESLNLDVSEGKILSAFKQLPPRLESQFFLHHAGGLGAGVNGKIVLPKENFEAADVVAVLVSEQNGAKACGVDAESMEADRDLFGTEADIDEETLAGGFDDDGVAAASAAEDCKFHLLLMARIRRIRELFFEQNLDSAI